MFRRMISMLLIGSLVIVGNDALASNGTVSARDARANERNKRTRESEQPAHEQPAPVQPARKRGKKTAAGVVGGGVVQQVVPPKVVSDLPPALKTAFTKAGVRNPEERNRLMHIVGGVKARQGQQAAQPVFTDKDLIDLLQNPKTIGELHDGAVEAVGIIDIVITNRRWKHFAPIADVLEAIRPQLVGFHGFIEAKIARGEWTLATPVDSVDSQPAEQVVEVIHCPGIGTKETTAVETQTDEPVVEVVHCPVIVIKETADFGMQTDEPVVKKEEATPWVTGGTATAVAGTVVCFVVAGVTMPIFVPTMAVQTAIGAGVGAGFGAFCSARPSLWKKEGCAGVAKSMLRGAAHGGFGGAFGSCVSVFGPTFVSPIAEHAVKFGLAGCVTGAVRGIDNNEILRQAFMGGALGGAFGAVYGSYQELRRYITSLQTKSAQLQQALAQSQKLEHELRAALQAGAIDKEDASKLIGQLKASLEQAVADNTQILGRLSEANALNDALKADLGQTLGEKSDALAGLSEAHALSRQQAATIAEQQTVIAQLRAALEAGAIDKEAASQYIGQLRDNLEQAVAENTEILGRLTQANAFNQKLSGDLGLAVAENTEILGRLSEAHAISVQQAATIAEQQAVITGQQTAAGMLQQEIEKNAAMLQGMRRELTDQLAANQELVARVAACEELAARSLADSTALVVSPFDMGTCAKQVFTRMPAKIFADPSQLHHSMLVHVPQAQEMLFDGGTCAAQGMSSWSGAPVGVDFGDSGLLGAPLHEGTANTFTSCYNAGRGSQECKGMMAGIRSAAGATAVTDWFRSWLPS